MILEFVELKTHFHIPNGRKNFLCLKIEKIIYTIIVYVALNRQHWNYPEIYEAN